MAATACTYSTGGAMAETREARTQIIPGVPFIHQTESTCGPAALAGVLTFWGKKVDIDRITEAIYLPKLKGTLIMDMELYARDAGFEAESRTGTVENVKQEIRRGFPVICLLDLGFWVYQRPHYITVFGYDDAQRVVICHDGVKRDQHMNYDDFAASWKRAGNWMLVVRPEKAEGGHA